MNVVAILVMSAKLATLGVIKTVLQINIPLSATMSRKTKKQPVKLNFWWSQ